MPGPPLLSTRITTRPRGPSLANNHHNGTGHRVKEITGGTPDDTLIARYEYDGQNRRVAKAIYSSGVLDHKLHNYYNENWQILEVRKETGGIESANPLKQYVWHTYYIDALAIRYYDPDADGSNIATQYFTHDANMNVTALTDDTGAVIERYDYTPYSQVTFLNPDFTTKSASDYEQDVLFAGYQYDTESGLQYVRNRYRNCPVENPPPTVCPAGMCSPNASIITKFRPY